MKTLFKVGSMLIAIGLISACSTVGSKDGVPRGARSHLDARASVLYTERVFLSDSRWMIFQGTHNRSLEGKAKLIVIDQGYSTGKQASYPIADAFTMTYRVNPDRLGEFVFEHKDFEQNFWMNSERPMRVLDDSGRRYEVDYFDLFYLTNLHKGSGLLLENEYGNTLSLSYENGEYSVNGEPAIKRSIPLILGSDIRSEALVTATGETYAFAGAMRQGSTATYWIVTNQAQIEVFNGVAF